jgi:hypothetical protein
MKFKVTIVETLSRIVDVEASDENEAYKIVEDMYLSEEVVLDSEDFDDVDFITFKA